MTHVTSFPPIGDPESRLLILGTMPGRMSLREQQYYAHPRNAFWHILGSVAGFSAQARYPDRVAALIVQGFAVWDVLRSCVRDGSLDSAIDESTLVANDFVRFFAEHPRIQRVCFNGAKAEALYRKHVLPALDSQPLVEYMRLPSTSPANASVPLDRKLNAWRAVLEDGLAAGRSGTSQRQETTSRPTCISS